MSRSRECVLCRYLGNCEETNGQKLLSHYVCVSYQEEAQEEIIRARLDIINKFGSAGVSSVISPETQKDE